MKGLKFPCRGELFGRHVNAGNRTRLAHQLTGNVHVSSGAAAQIQHGRARQVVRRQAQTTTVIFGHGRGMQIVDAILNIRGWRSGRTTRIGGQIVRGLQIFAIIILDRCSRFVD